ncbi:hypothetical protein Y1Q_0006868 [Alligator mississippiensis]|uniref:Uncharacterized protein n=1 Tax=Alligator mississippiensis TaxID=8496 RepID=A0A151M5W9_ALLMI|nr:hypothetical protein Y1Q_0006868 [Alligator mississippiensis]
MDPGTCPIIHRFVAPGVQATIPLHLPWASTALCKLDPRHVQCAWVLVLALGQAYYLDSAFQGHIVLHPLGLVIQDMTAEMEGEYQVLLGHNKTCLARVILTPVGHLFHYRFLLLLPGLLVMSVILLLWDWLIKVRSSTETHEGLTHMHRVPLL